MAIHAPTWLIPSCYFPAISWFTALAQAEEAVIDLNVAYTKQQYTNRMFIRGPNAVMALSVPVARRGDQVKMVEKRIAYQEKWQRAHWRSIYFSYKNSPYFEYYADHFSPIFEQPYEFLWELNAAIIQQLVKLFSLDIAITYSKEAPPHDQGTIDLRKDFHPRREAWPQWYAPVSYTQVFEGFEPDLSALDLLCNKGPESGQVLAEGWRGLGGN